MSDSDFSHINANISYNPTPSIVVNDTRCDEYLVILYWLYKNEWMPMHYDYTFKPHVRWHSFITTRNKWKWKVYGFENQKITLLLEDTYNETKKNIVFNLFSESSEIDKEYISKAIKFQKENDCFVFVKTQFADLLKNPFIKVVDKSFEVPNAYASFDIKRNEIFPDYGKKYSTQSCPYRSKVLENFNHQRHWMDYSQTDLFDDIINYE